MPFLAGRVSLALCLHAPGVFNPTGIFKAPSNSRPQSPFADEASSPGSVPEGGGDASGAKGPTLEGRGDAKQTASGPLST